MFSKCKCNNCSESVEFPIEMARQSVECPHCKLETVLFLPPREPEAPKIVIEAPLSHTMLPPAPIEDKLETIGGVFFFFGITGACICSFVFLCNAGNSNLGQNHDEENIWLVTAAIICVAQGIIIQTLFRAAAEVIILLRKLVAKT
jgi:hypothetical protein